LGRRFNEELMPLKKWPKPSIRDSMRKWREDHAFMVSKTTIASEGSSIANPRDGGSNDSPIQDVQEPVSGSGGLAARKSRNPKRRKTKNNRAS